MNKTNLRAEESTIDEDNQNSSELDDEIESLQLLVSCLRAQRSIQAATILSFNSTLSTLCHIRDQKEVHEILVSTADLNSLISTAETLHLRNQTNLYRLCATVTSFLIEDPDPNAVDQGRILTLRFDVSNSGRFIRPYYLMLNKPWEGEQKELFYVYRHTLPPGIPLDNLIEKYLPSGKGTLAVGVHSRKEAPQQTLIHFTRGLRHAILSYHNRLLIIESLRTEFKIDDRNNENEKSEDMIFVNVSAIDAEIKQLRFEWADGRIGRVVIDEDGEVKKCIVIGEKGRDRVTEGALNGLMRKLCVKLNQD